MSTTFDSTEAHKHFSSNCFNSTWDLLDKPDRSPEEDEQMLMLAFASAWHWSQRPDQTATTRSISYWQISRVYAVIGQADNARIYAQRCLEVSQESGVEAFYLAYAYEALARAEKAAGDLALAEAYLEDARQMAEKITDLETKSMLLTDLETI